MADSTCLFTPPGQLDCRLLLVEDDRDHQPLLCLMFEKAGATVTIAENGRVAIQLAHAAQEAGMPFDIVVMDLQMPVLDGVSATRELRAKGFTAPIIALTARCIAAERDRCLAAGCDAFVSKPVTRIDIVRLLASHLGSPLKYP